MNADNQMIEAIRRKNRQIEQMLNKDNTDESLSLDESDGEGEGDYYEGESQEEEEEQENYYQQIKQKQLNAESYNQPKNPTTYNPLNNGPKIDYAAALKQLNIMNTSNQSGYSKGLNLQVNQTDAQPHDDSDHDEPQSDFANMKSKFQNMQMEHARMFDDDNIEPHEQNDNEIKPKMETIEEGYSSDDSFGAQIKHKNFKENFEFVMEEKKKKENQDDQVPQAQLKGKRGHINVKTRQDNKENKDTRNQKLSEKKSAPQPDMQKPSTSLKRPGTAKMRGNTGVSATYSRPQTAKSTKTKKRPGTAFMSTASTFNSSKTLKTKKSKKSDPVSRYQSMQNSWNQSKFLSKNKGTKEGRKLDLAGYNQWAKVVQNSQVKPVVKQIHRYINPLEAPTTGKRDDLRFHLRAKMSQEDYVDDSMRYFHYTKN